MASSLPMASSCSWPRWPDCWGCRAMQRTAVGHFITILWKARLWTSNLATDLSSEPVKMLSLLVAMQVTGSECFVAVFLSLPRRSRLVLKSRTKLSLPPVNIFLGGVSIKASFVCFSEFKPGILI